MLTAMATASSVDSRPSSERQAVLVYLRLRQTQEMLTDEACFVASTPKELLAIPPKESQTFKNVFIHMSIRGRAVFHYSLACLCALFEGAVIRGNTVASYP